MNEAIDGLIAMPRLRPDGRLDGLNKGWNEQNVRQVFEGLPEWEAQRRKRAQAQGQGQVQVKSKGTGAGQGSGGLGVARPVVSVSSPTVGRRGS